MKHDLLFRREVSEEKRYRLEGGILLSQPVTIVSVTALILIIILGLSIWIAAGTYTRSETAPGILVTDVPATKIIATRAGRIADLAVRDGDIVRAGQRLATVIVTQPAGTGVDTSAASLQALEMQRKLSEQQGAIALQRSRTDRAGLLAALASYGEQKAQVLQQIALQRQTVASMRATLDGIEPVMSRGFVSRIEYESRKQAWLTAREQLAQMVQQSSNLDAEEAKARADLARVTTDSHSQFLTAETAAAGYAGQRAEALSQQAYEIVAPVAGRVTALQAALGKTIDGVMPLMEIVPDGSRLHAEIYAPSRSVGFVRQGQEVRLLYDAFPYQRFGSFAGHVTAVSRTVLDPREIAAPIKSDEPVFRIDVAITGQSVSAYGAKLPLQSGMTLNANLILDRRPFSEWLLEPLHAVLKRTG